MGRESTLAALLPQLRDDLGHRRIEQGIRTLERVRHQIDALGAEDIHGGVTVGLIAQWVDAGFDGPDLLRRLLCRFPPQTRLALPLLDYLHLRVAEGLIAMVEENFDCATGHFRFVQSLEDTLDDAALLAVANFWTGRCLRKMGRYDDALDYTIRGEELALSCGYPPMAAVMQLSRGWLAFQMGKLAEATSILHHAEEVLGRTGDFVNRGNVQSAYGRIARRQGKYERAAECFERSIDEYRKSGSGHLQLARSLLNLAFVKRLLALRLQKTIDHVSASRRSAGTGQARRTPGETAGALHLEHELLGGRREANGEVFDQEADHSREQRQKCAHLRAEAQAHLHEALSTYGLHNNHRGIAGVHITLGFLALDSGDLEHASIEADEGFRVGAEKHDNIVMARARTLQCVIENAALEEQVGEPLQHQEAGEEFARDALRYAGETQNRRLLARAWVWQGLTHLARPFGDIEAARHCYEQAITLLQPDAAERPHIWDELEKLRAKVLRTRPIDPMLRAWSAGVVNDKSFQQITEEFARIVIPKVWEREGRKVSRVAERLSISPKKVRRILHSLGLLDTPERLAGPSHDSELT